MRFFFCCLSNIIAIYRDKLDDFGLLKEIEKKNEKLGFFMD